MRSKNSMLNFLTGITGQIIMLLLGFVSRNLFLMFLSIEYLGVSGLFSSLLTMLSLAELGVGNAIIYSLYKPLADKNYEEIKSLMHLFKKVYNIIGIIVLVAGIILSFFLDFFVPDRKGIENLEIIFILFVIQTASSYFFSYNRSLITADQKAYKLIWIDYGNKILHVILPIIALAVTRSYIVYLVTQIIVSNIFNIWTYTKVRNLYPVLKEKTSKRIPQKIKKQIIKNTSALIIYKVAIVITASTDNILLSRFFGLDIVGLCANYTLIIQNMTGVLSQGITSVTASIGNLTSSENSDKKYSIFRTLFFVNFWIYGYAAIGIYFCATPLVSLIFGQQYIIDQNILLAMVLGFFILGMQNACSVFRDAEGLFWYGKLRPLAQTIVNIIASVALAIVTNNVSSIFWGTVISRMTTSFWYDPLVVHKFSLNKPLRYYFIRYGIYIMVLTVAFIMCLFAIRYINFEQPVLNLCKNIVLVSLIVNFLFYVVFLKTSEFKYLKNMLINLIKNGKK